MNPAFLVCKQHTASVPLKLCYNTDYLLDFSTECRPSLRHCYKIYLVTFISLLSGSSECIYRMSNHKRNPHQIKPVVLY